MKNIYRILVLILITSISACNDSDELSENVNGLSVVETSVSFSPTGGNQGYIKVNLTEGYSATSNQNWCTLSLDKDVIKVSATVNSQLESRAALVTISYGNKKEEVAVYQHGVQFSIEKTALIFDLDDEGPEKLQKIKIKSNLTLTVTVADPWITATIRGDSLLVYCNSAATEKRSTDITLNLEDVSSVVVTVSQEPPSYESYLGGWTLTGTDYATNSIVTYPNVIITQKVNGVSYNVTGWAINPNLTGQTFEMLYDPATGRISINGSQHTGVYLIYEIHFVGIVPYNNSTTVITGDYTALNGRLKQSQGSVNLEYANVTLSDDVTYQFIGMVYRLRLATNSWTYFNTDPYILNNAVLTKK